MHAKLVLVVLRSIEPDCEAQPHGFSLGDGVGRFQAHVHRAAVVQHLVMQLTSGVVVQRISPFRSLSLDNRRSGGKPADAAGRGLAASGTT
jgi:hypothetical protein